MLQERKFFIREYLSNRFTVTELAKRFGISRKTASKYIKRYKNYGEDGLNDLSRAPKHNFFKTQPMIENTIVNFKRDKRNRNFGAKKVLEVLKRENPKIEFPSATTVSNILKHHGFPQKKVRHRHNYPSKPFIDPQKPNDVWATDFKGHFPMGNRRIVHPLTISDLYSRYIIGIKGLYNEKRAETQRFFIRVFLEYGLPKYILSDNGAPFGHIQAVGRLTGLSVWFIKLGITPIFIKPGNPQHNAIHERMHRVLKRETALPPSYDLRTQQRSFNTFRNTFNTYRPHEVWDGDVPAKHYIISDRKYPKKIKKFDYPSNYKKCYVCRNGKLRWAHNTWVLISTTLIEEYVGLEEIDDGIWCVWFRHVRLGYMDERNRRIVDDLGRIKRNLIVTKF